MKLAMHMAVDGISEHLKKMLDRSNRPQGFNARVAYPMILAAQRKRFMTENESEGDKWAPLSTKPFFAFWETDPKLKKQWPGGYREYKKTKFASFDGHGTKTLIATGELLNANIGKSKRHRRIAENTRVGFEVSTDQSTEYFQYLIDGTDKMPPRPWNQIGNRTRDEIAKRFADYIVGG